MAAAWAFLRRRTLTQWILVAMVAGGVLRTSTNSGKVASGRNSASLSALARDEPASRPSAIHCRTSASVTGPYSLPSPPMMR